MNREAIGTEQRPLNRRGFLQMAGALALATTLGGHDRALAAGERAQQRTAGLGWAHFAALEGQTFRIQLAPGLSHPMRLEAVRQHLSAAEAAANPRREWFSLHFVAPPDRRLEQGTYTFFHPRLGRFELFVVPAMAVEHEERLIAILNRI